MTTTQQKHNLTITHHPFRKMSGFLFLVCAFVLWVNALHGCLSPTNCPPQGEECTCSTPDAAYLEEPRNNEPHSDVTQEVMPEALVESTFEATQPEETKINLPTRCQEPKADFYQSRWSDAALAKLPAGSVLRCEALGQRSALSLAQDPLFLASGGQPTAGYRLFRMIYKSTGVAGKPIATSALVYVPYETKGSCQQAPVSVVAHGTVGSAPLCGPSRSPALTIHYMTLPLAGRGHLVIVPDYPGLGLPTSAIHPYLVVEPTASAILDSVKAGQWIGRVEDSPACPSSNIFLLGHSQGGHAVLVAAERFKTQLPDQTLRGVVSYAPAFGDPRVWLGPFDAAVPPTYGTAYLLLFLLGTATHLQIADLSALLTPRAATLLPALAQSFCFGEFSAFLLQNFAKIDEIFSPRFLQAAQQCNQGQGDCTSFSPWYESIRTTQPGSLPLAGPLLLVQGSQDTLVTSTSVECLARRYATQSLQRCVFANADHSSIVGLSWGSILPWLKTRVTGGQDPATCPSDKLPSCP